MDSSKPKRPFSSLNPRDTGELIISGAGEMVVSYKECLKNHAASFGGHALDGCGEFMPTATANPTDPSSLRCAACGCHRNFHRRDHSDNNPHHLHYHSYFRGSPTPTTPSDPQSPLSPPLQPVASPVPYSYYASAPHVLLSLSAGLPGPSDHDNDGENHPTAGNSSRGTIMRRRTRTKFTPEQKVKLRAFAEKAGWKINGCDEKSVRAFCGEVGIDRGVLKVWMHNNKYSVNSKNRDMLTDRRLCLNSHSYNNGGDGENDDDVRLRVSGNGSSSS